MSEDKVLGILDEGWLKKAASHPIDLGRYEVNMGRDIGTSGEQILAIIVRPGTKEVLTSYPIKVATY